MTTMLNALFPLSPFAADMVGPTAREDLRQGRRLLAAATAMTVFGVVWFRTGWALAACAGMLGLWLGVEVLVHRMTRRLVDTALAVAADTDDPIRYLAEFEAFCALPREDRDTVTGWLVDTGAVTAFADTPEHEPPAAVLRWRDQIARRQPPGEPQP